MSPSMLICIREINADDRYYDMPREKKEDKVNKQSVKVFAQRCAYVST